MAVKLSDLSTAYEHFPPSLPALELAAKHTPFFIVDAHRGPPGNPQYKGERLICLIELAQDRNRPANAPRYTLFLTWNDTRAPIAAWFAKQSADEDGTIIPAEELGPLVLVARTKGQGVIIEDWAPEP